MQDETKTKLAEQQNQRSLFKRMRKAILDGDWLEVDKLCSKMIFQQQQKSFLYAAYREQFIELIEAQEYQKAFTHLTKRLKPLESSAASIDEFKNLCYLLTCRSVHEVLPHWQGVSAAREALLLQFSTMLDLEERHQEGEVSLPDGRLITLLEQAAAHQIARSTVSIKTPTFQYEGSEPASHSTGHGVDSNMEKSGVPAWRRTAPLQVGSLLQDYASPGVPNTSHRILYGHNAGLKSVAWMGDSGLLLSGGNDHTIRVWDTRNGDCIGLMNGHVSRVWQLAVGCSALQIASASADGTVKLWRPTGTERSRGDIASSASVHDNGFAYDRDQATCSSPTSGSTSNKRLTTIIHPSGSLNGHIGDVFSVCFHPTDNQLVSSGYDMSVRVFDTALGTEIRSLIGHGLPVREAIFNATGLASLWPSLGREIALLF